MSDQRKNQTGRLREVPSYPGVIVSSNGTVIIEGNYMAELHQKPVGPIPNCPRLRMFEDFVEVPDLNGEMVEVTVRELMHEVFKGKEITRRFYRYKRIKHVFDPPRRSTRMKPGLERDVKKIMEEYSNVL